MTDFTLLPQIVDGFCYNTPFNRPHKPFNYFALQLERLDALRRQQGNYRMRQYVTPLNLIQTVGAYSTFRDQVRMTQGTYIWALTFCIVTAGGLITDFNLTLTDHDTGEDFFSSPVSGGISNYPLVQILDEPRPVLGSAQIDVTMVNRVNATRTPQLIISCAEPCVIVGGAA